MDKKPLPFKKGQVLELKIEKLAYKGIGIGYIDQEKNEKDEAGNIIKVSSTKLVVFVPQTLPGEVCEVVITKMKKQFWEGKKIKTIEKSAMEIEAPCPYFGVCGGCKWQNMPYDKQLETKEGFIKESLKYIGRANDPYDFLPIVPSPDQYFYRNKLELSAGVLAYIGQGEYHEKKEEVTEKIEGFYLGFHGAGSFDKIVDVDSCLLLSETANQVLVIVKDFIKKRKLSAYNARTHEGFIRHLVIREGKNTGEMMVNLVTNATEDYTVEFFQPLVDEFQLLEKDNVKFESVLWTQNDSLSDTAVGTNIQVIHGREYIFDKVGEYLFKISPYSFFQTNTHGAEKLYDVVKEFADLQGGETVLDLYAGTGTIGMYLAKAAKKVFSLESEVSAVEDAKVNATMNNIMNIEFMCGKVEKEIARLIFEKPEVIVLDPPRAGMHPNALQFLPRFNAKKIIYVSCNPTTLGRDLEFLQRWYTVKRVQGVDMFPQTYHVETVVELIRK
ncbi:MAG: 23S rRNA (uracil(1939)-C(5))-methyltransferase RlmD [Candidatus Gracilibacteria bacterium]